MSKRLLTDTFETIGEWFRPDEPANIIAGSIHQSPRGTQIRLDGAFTPLRGSIGPGDTIRHYPVVHGTTREGDRMTLLDVSGSLGSLHIKNAQVHQVEWLQTSLLLIGQHLSSTFAYPLVRFRVPGLQIWLSKRSIDSALDERTGDGGRIFVFRVLAHGKEVTQLPEIDGVIEWSTEYDAKLDQFTAVSVTVSGWFTIRPRESKCLAWYLEQQRKISAMLTFLTGTPMPPDCIEASVDGEPHHTVAAMVALPDAAPCSYFSPHDFFVLRNDMGVDLERVMRTWIGIYPKIDSPSRLAVSVFSSKSLWQHVEFLSHMQALEGFHRALFDGNYISEDDYRPVKKALGDAIPTTLSNDHKDALRSRIKYGYQYSLQKRLDGLAMRLSEPLRERILGADGRIPRAWIDTRNYYTHWDENLRPNVLDGQDMYNANVRIEHFIRALYLDLMGLPQDVILKALSNGSAPSQRLVWVTGLERRRINPDDQYGAYMAITEHPSPAPKESAGGSLTSKPSPGEPKAD